MFLTSMSSALVRSVGSFICMFTLIQEPARKKGRTVSFETGEEETPDLHVASKTQKPGTPKPDSQSGTQTNTRDSQSGTEISRSDIQLGTGSTTSRETQSDTGSVRRDSQSDTETTRTDSQSGTGTPSTDSQSGTGYPRRDSQPTTARCLHVISRQECR